MIVIHVERSQPQNTNNTRNSRNCTMAEVKKQEKDFTPEVDALIPEATTLAKVYSIEGIAYICLTQCSFCRMAT